MKRIFSAVMSCIILGILINFQYVDDTIEHSKSGLSLDLLLKTVQTMNVNKVAKNQINIEKITEIDNVSETILKVNSGKSVDFEKIPDNYRESLALAKSADSMNRLNVIEALWRFSADKGVPEEALETLQEISFTEEGVISDLANLAYEDLIALKKGLMSQYKLAPVNSKSIVYDNEETERIAMENEIYSAKYGDTEQIRLESIQNLSSYRNGKMLSEVKPLMFDLSSDIRIKAIETVWKASIDLSEVTDMDDISRTMYQVSRDIDQRVAEIAKIAYDDIQGIIQRQELLN